jgi:monoterpene epsilon-lactone hydrolase
MFIGLNAPFREGQRVQAALNFERAGEIDVSFEVGSVGAKGPLQIVASAPGVDASISRPEHMAIAARDPVRDIPGIIEAGRLYAGGLDVAHPYVSPLNGDFRGLAPMIVFTGTLDLLYPDSIELADKARAAGVPIELYLRQGQPHNYAGMPTPEGRQARAIILRAVAQGLT